MRIKQRLADLGLIVLTICPPSFGIAQHCVEPSAQQQQNVTAYIAKQNHIANLSDLALVKNEQANDACFWKFEYENGQKRTITTYLSPDRTFLTSELYDLRIDPLAEEKKNNESTAKALLAGDPPAIGVAQAPVILVEFSDFECPYCQRLKTMLEQDVLPKEKGKVKVVFRNFPLTMHPWAKPAAMMATCAELQNESAFWKLHDFLFENQRDFTADNLTPKVTEFVATKTNLNKTQFQKCLDNDMALGIVTKDIALGQQYGVRATPTAFVNGVRYEGMQSAAQLLSIIDAAASGNSASLVLPTETAGDNRPNECVKPSATAARPSVASANK
jgi:protein-disulfide isomerase